MSPSAQPHEHRDGGSSPPSSLSMPSHAPSDAASTGNVPSPQQTTATAPRAPRSDQEFAQAFRDLARGEQTAAALEANLTNLESKLDELLAAFEDIAGDSPAPLANGNRQQEDLDPKHQTDNTADKSN